MSPCRRNCRAVSLILIGALLFAQAAFAVRPCVEPNMSAAAVVAAQPDHEYCETEVTGSALCAIQCADGDELPGQKYRWTSDLPPDAAAPAPHPFLPRLVAGGEWLRLQRNLVADPPPAVRFCRLLN